MDRNQDIVQSAQQDPVRGLESRTIVPDYEHDVIYVVQHGSVRLVPPIGTLVVDGKNAADIVRRRIPNAAEPPGTYLAHRATPASAKRAAELSFRSTTPQEKNNAAPVKSVVPASLRGLTRNVQAWGPTKIDCALDTEPFTPESAVQYFAAYVHAKRTRKPSLRRLFEAGEVLFQKYGEKPRKIGRLIKVDRGNPQKVVQHVSETKRMLPEAKLLIERAEAAGRRISFVWLHGSVHGRPLDEQRLSVHAKARGLNISLD